MSYSPKKCPTPGCKASLGFNKKGFHHHKRLNQKFRIFQCKACKRHFTSRTFRADYRQKRPDLNKDMTLRIIRGQSLRSIAECIGLTYYNTYKKFLWLKRIVEYHRQFVKFSAKSIQFD